ncbi:MAG TPA: CHAT domain-containing tetratricopeptide repeat protein [Bryobacteraceae bacterium]|nr:CHAT domain-containing tetratricopeptide repeat protein [Bryobacteraceae bacterium]
MRTVPWLLSLLLCLAVCDCTKKPSPDVLYRTTQSLLYEGKLKEALATVDSGLKVEPSWRFRFLKAEILLPIGPRRVIPALDETDRPSTPEIQARYKLYRGRAETALSDYGQAQADLDEARKLAAPLNLPLLNAEIGLYQGTLLAQQGNGISAEEHFRSALREATNHNDPFLQVRAMGSLGVLFRLTHRLDEATYWLEKQRDTADHIGWVRSRTNAVGNLGVCYYRLGEYTQALKFLGDAEAAARQSGDPGDQQVWLGNIANVHVEEGEYAAALEPYKRALEITKALGDQPDTATWLNNLAIASVNLGDFDAAERYNDEALALKQKLKQRSVYYSRLNEARIAAGRKDFVRAEKLFRALLVDPSEDPVPLVEAQAGLAELLVKTGQLTVADAQFRTAITTLERQREGLTRDEYKFSYLSSLIKFYQYYVDFLVARGEPERALEVVESSRALVLDEKLHRAGKNEGSVSAATLRKIAGSSRSTLLSYWLGPERSFLWVITPEAVLLHVLPPEKQIATLIEVYGGQIEQLRDPLESELPAGKKLSEILLGPLRPLLSKGTRLILVPDRALHSLNLETLPDPDDSSRYLIDRVTMSVAPSLGLLTEAHRPSNKQPSILLIGDPETAIEEYPHLPYAAKEMSLIEQSFSPDRRVVAEGAHAYPAVYRESKPARFSWIHFAAHATTNRESPLDSALILSQHGSGYALTARDVMNVPLNADLVTLSACRSAGARMYSGEGLVGLSWAFLRAGAGSVVAGLWDVTDMSTATLMADFYAQLVKNVAPAEALRQAKLHLLHSNNAYKKPFYWGPFQLYTGAASR